MRVTLVDPTSGELPEGLDLRIGDGPIVPLDEPTNKFPDRQAERIHAQDVSLDGAVGRSFVKQRSNVMLGAGGLGLLLAAAAVPALAQQLTNQTFQTNINIEIAPVAELTFEGANPLLYLEIPPEDFTIPGSGVNFSVTGNADATLIAEPDAFIEVVTEDGLHIWARRSRAQRRSATSWNSDFREQVPREDPLHDGCLLPGFEEGPTAPPLLVDLSSTGQQRTGVLHMEAHPNWTPSGGIPLPGIYVGAVTLTLTASD